MGLRTTTALPTCTSGSRPRFAREAHEQKKGRPPSVVSGPSRTAMSCLPSEQERGGETRLASLRLGRSGLGGHSAHRLTSGGAERNVSPAGGTSRDDRIGFAAQNVSAQGLNGQTQAGGGVTLLHSSIRTGCDSPNRRGRRGGAEAQPRWLLRSDRALRRGWNCSTGPPRTRRARAQHQSMTSNRRFSVDSRQS